MSETLVKDLVRRYRRDLSFDVGESWENDLEATLADVKEEFNTTASNVRRVGHAYFSDLDLTPVDLVTELDRLTEKLKYTLGKVHYVLGLRQARNSDGWMWSYQPPVPQEESDGEKQDLSDEIIIENESKN